MTIDLETRADAWLAQARAKLGDAALGPQAEQIGRIEEVGDVTMLVNNAGTVNSAKLLLDLTQEEIVRLFQVCI